MVFDNHWPLCWHGNSVGDEDDCDNEDDDDDNEIHFDVLNNLYRSNEKAC